MEQAVTFEVSETPCLGIVHQPERMLSTAVLIVVGGPQYRVGSHRQFVQLSRALADANIASLRFDYRGMGDSAGSKQDFDAICQDIEAAIDCLMSTIPHIERVVIWGLCDAASAALIYAPNDARVCGLVLLNPWLRNEQAMAKTMVKYYYLRRLCSLQFWKRLLGGKVNVGGSLADASNFVKDTRKSQQVDKASYQQRMLTGLQHFEGNICLILSGVDLTAREFDQQTHNNKAWSNLRLSQNEIHRIPNADHTFSSKEYKKLVEQISYRFADKLNTILEAEA